MAALGELHTAENIPQLVDWTVNNLSEQFGCDFSVWTQFDNRGEMRSAILGNIVDVSSWKYGAVIAHFVRSEHPVLSRFLETQSSSEAGRNSDFIPQNFLDNTSLYREAYRHIGARRQLSSIFKGPEGSIYTCAFGRNGADYTAEQAGAIRTLTLHFQLALSKLWHIESLERSAENSIQFHAVWSNKWYFSFISDSGAQFFQRHFRETRALYEIPGRLSHSFRAAEIIPQKIRCDLGRQWIVSAGRYNRRELKVNVREGSMLTLREEEILSWVSQGKRDSEIGMILGISSRTVGKHLENILSKLNVETRGAAAATWKQF